MVIYIILGFFDALAMLLLMLKLYMLPFRAYGVKIAYFVFFISTFSYMMRITLESPKLDLPLQYILFVLFLRFGMELKVHLSAFIAGAGISAYAAIQMAIYHLFHFFDVMHVSVIQQNEGSMVYLLQSASILITCVISFVLSIFDYGFSFIIRPPHDFLKKENYLSSTNLPYLIGTVISAFTICLTLILLYSSDPTWLLVLTILTFGVSYFFSTRRERGDIRAVVEAYRIKHKSG